MTQSSAARKNSILIIATLSSFIVPFLVSSINVALPRMTAEFHMEAVVMTWVNTIYFLAIAMVQVPMGRLADIHGRKKIYLVGLVISLAAALAGAFAGSVPVLLVSRAFQGIGAGMMGNTIIAIITSVFPSDERGKALGISMAGTYGGLIFGPLIGGFLTYRFGWPSIFIASAGLSSLSLILALLTLKGEWREAKGEKFDFPGSVLFGASIAMFIYGFSSLPGVISGAFLVVGAAGLFCFAKRELKAASPILDLRIFKNNRTFLFSNMATLINYLATFAVTFLLSLYLQYIKGFSPQEAGLVMIASSIPMTIVTPLAGRLSDKIDPRMVAASGMALGCAALVMLIFLGNGTSLWYVILALAVYGTGIGFFSSPNTNAIMGSVGKKVLGVASGTIGTMRTTGMMLSLGIMMILFAVYIGPQEIEPVYYPRFLTSVKVGFIVFTVLGIGGVLAQLIGREKA
jgi:EmrB/QacA subfamily drug resistance transporter